MKRSFFFLFVVALGFSQAFSVSYTVNVGSVSVEKSAKSGAKPSLMGEGGLGVSSKAYVTQLSSQVSSVVIQGSNSLVTFIPVDVEEEARVEIEVPRTDLKPLGVEAKISQDSPEKFIIKTGASHGDLAVDFKKEVPSFNQVADEQSGSLNPVKVFYYYFTFPSNLTVQGRARVVVKGAINLPGKQCSVDLGRFGFFAVEKGIEVSSFTLSGQGSGMMIASDLKVDKALLSFKEKSMVRIARVKASQSFSYEAENDASLTSDSLEAEKVRFVCRGEGQIDIDLIATGSLELKVDRDARISLNTAEVDNFSANLNGKSLLKAEKVFSESFQGNFYDDSQVELGTGIINSLVVDTKDVLKFSTKDLPVEKAAVTINSRLLNKKGSDFLMQLASVGSDQPELLVKGYGRGTIAFSGDPQVTKESSDSIKIYKKHSYLGGLLTFKRRYRIKKVKK